jgi:hypothetical protein
MGIRVLPSRITLYVWDSVTVGRWALAVWVLLASLGLAACSTTASPVPTRPPICAAYSGIEHSLVSDHGGQSSPVKAAEWFAIHGGVPNIPAGKWHEVNHNSQGATVYSGKTLLHIVRGSDGTWLVDSGKRCS